MTNVPNNLKCYNFVISKNELYDFLLGIFFSYKCMSNKILNYKSIWCSDLWQNCIISL